MSFMPILEVTRGGVVESLHYGAFVVADPLGNVLHSWGTEQVITFLRSSAKPFQVIPLIERGGMERFGLSGKQLALMCASHSGSDEHVAVIESIQKLVGVSEDQLVCGTHPPSDQEARSRLIREGKHPTPNRHNCSGKHTAMLALAVMLGQSTEGYSLPQHPVQQLILKTMSEMFEIEPGSITIGTDGCSVPTFAVPLKAAAIALARFADPSMYSEARQQACKVVWQAMTEYPQMVAGRGRFDTELMQVFNGLVLSKGGAEGVQAIAIAPGVIAPNSPGLGIALKISDGDRDTRARGYISISILRRLGVVDDQVLKVLDNFSSPTITNWQNLIVGDLRSAYIWDETD